MKGSDIKKYRDKNSLTQQELANMLGLTRKTINTYENNDNIPVSKEKLFHFIFNESLPVLIKNETEISIKEITDFLRENEDWVVNNEFFKRFLAYILTNNEDVFLKVKTINNIIENKVAKEIIRIQNNPKAFKEFLKKK